VPSSTIRLFEVEPDLLRFVAPEDRELASKVAIPLLELANGDFDAVRALHQAGAFGGIVIEGMLLHSMRLGDRVGLRLIGPGDLMSLPDSPRSILVANAICRVIAPGRLALFEGELLRAARRWPSIIGGLHARSGEQADRIATQLMICQLTRVHDRLLSLLWLLAESWGTVTTSGTLLPISLTHEALGRLIGARRPTVTLALGELTGAGALVREDRGWLLLQHPPGPGGASPPGFYAPRLLEDGSPTEWATHECAAAASELTVTAL
jgi:hypothetical protein